MSDERTKALIAALLNEDGRTEAEAASAREKAARLLVRHGLTEAEVLSEDRDMARADTELGRHDWIVVKFLGGAIARLTGTTAWYRDLPAKTGRRSDRKLYSFAGYRPDVEQADWLMATVLAAGKAAARGVGNDRSKSDLLAAFAVTVARRLRDLTEATDTARAAAGSTALVPVKQANVDEYVREITGGLRDSRTRGRSLRDGAAAAEGRRAGAAVSLSRPLGKGPLAIR